MVLNIKIVCGAGKCQEQDETMGHLVRVVVGDWQRVSQGAWKFEIDHVEVKYDVVVRENGTYESLVEIIREKYRVPPTDPIALTYDFPEWMKVPGDYTAQPVDIREDGDVELFMSVMMDFVDLHLCVTFGQHDVSRYMSKRREEYGVADDGTDVVPPKPIPWRCKLHREL